MSELFRKEAITAHTKKLHGNVSLAQPIPFYIITILLFLTIIALGLYLSFSNYARKETVKGYLLPDKGVIKSFANKNGVLEILHVNEGGNVVAGDPLATIIVKRNMLSGDELSESLLIELYSQLDKLELEKEQYVYLQSKDKERLVNNIIDIKSEIDLNAFSMNLLQDKLVLHESQLLQYEKLNKSGYLSNIEYQKEKEILIDIKKEKNELKIKTLNLNRKLKDDESKLETLPNEYKIKIVAIDTKKSTVKNKIDETENNYRHTIVASESGVVNSINAFEGEYISVDKPLMSIIPKDSVLEAELLLPTRSAGFVKVGDIARLRFDAFPYQRFGALTSVITRVDAVILMDGEARLPISFVDPVYRIRTRVSEENIKAYGGGLTLKSGMLLEADIILDKRSLFDWLLEPIQSLNGRVG